MGGYLDTSKQLGINPDAWTLKVALSGWRVAKYLSIPSEPNSRAVRRVGLQTQTLDQACVATTNLKCTRLTVSQWAWAGLVHTL